MAEISYLFLLLGVFSIQGSSENLEENLALKGTAVQSSTYYSCGAAKAIDGIRYSPSGKPTPEETYTYCSITDYELNPWWRLDLLDHYSIYKVTITNRGDGWLTETAGVEIRIGNSLENNGNNNPRCGVTSLVPAGSSVSFSCGGMEGRYVNMYLPNIQMYLALCEVEVYGTIYRKKVFLRMKLTSSDDAAAVSNTLLNQLQSALGLSDVKLSWMRLPYRDITHKEKKTARTCADKR